MNRDYAEMAGGISIEIILKCLGKWHGGNIINRDDAGHQGSGESYKYRMSASSNVYGAYQCHRLNREMRGEYKV